MHFCFFGTTVAFNMRQVQLNFTNLGREKWHKKEAW